MSNNYLQNLISQAKYLAEHNQVDSDKYLQIYEELSNNQNGIIRYEDPKTKEILHESLTDKQIFQIRQQVFAYKYLIRNMNLPRELEKNIYNLSKDQWEMESDRILQKSLKFYNEKVEKNTQLKQLVKEKMQKRDQLQEQDQTSQFFIEKKQYFIDKRKIEIQKVLQQQELFNKECVQKLQLELKLLNNYDNYRSLSNKVQKGLAKNSDYNPQCFNSQILDRQFYKREKPPRKISDLNMEKFELNFRVEQHKRKKQKHQEFLQKLYQHQLEFNEFHKKLRKQANKRSKQAKNYLEQIEKRKQEEEERKQRERIKALRDNKYEDYLNLIQETKNSRIKELLRKTDDYLKDLGAKVLQQKGEKKDKEEAEEEQLKNNGNDYDVKQMKEANSNYYNLTHTVQESVIEQPQILEGGKLKHYQLIGLQWMVSLYNNKLNGILADEMGLGKTIQTISLFSYLIEVKKVPGKFLVVIPLSTMSNWAMEFQKWAPTIDVVAYKGSPQVRKELAKKLKQPKWHVCLTTYDYILKDKQLLAKFPWKYIVVDEGHRMKNARSKFAQVLGQQYQSDYRILLTGTPLQNNLGELWALLNFLLPKVFKSCEEFEKWFSIPVSKISGDREDQALTEEEQLLIITRLHQVLRPFVLRRVKKEVEKELPDKVEYVVKIEQSPWQIMQEKQIKARQQNILDPTTGKVQNIALKNLMMQLRKIANHPYLFLEPEQYDHDNDMIWRVSGKFELLDRIIPKLRRFKHKILLFTQMTKLLDILDIYFTYRGWKFLRLDGSTKEDERGERMRAFNAPDSDYEIFMLSTRAGGLGLNLQTADTVIIFDSDWNPQQDLQAQDRAHRIGQKNKVKVLRFITNTWIEKEILAKASQKIHLDDMIIQTGMYNNKATEADRQEKIKEMLDQNNQQKDVDDDIPNDEQMNDWLQRSPEEFEAYQQMDRERYEIEKTQYENFVNPLEEDKEENEIEEYQKHVQTQQDLEEENNNNNDDQNNINEIINPEDEYKTTNYRLCNIIDVPDYIRNPPQMEEENREYGRGSRIRKQVDYNDEESELKFLNSIALPDQISDDDDNPNQRRTRGARGRKKVQTQQQDEFNQGEDGQYQQMQQQQQFNGEDLQVLQNQQDLQNGNQMQIEQQQQENQLPEVEQQQQNTATTTTNGTGKQPGKGRGRPSKKKKSTKRHRFDNAIPNTLAPPKRTTRTTRNSRRVIDSEEEHEQQEDIPYDDESSSGYNENSQKKNGRSLRSKAQSLDQLESQRRLKKQKQNKDDDDNDYDNNNNEPEQENVEQIKESDLVEQKQQSLIDNNNNTENYQLNSNNDLVIANQLSQQYNNIQQQ